MSLFLHLLPVAAEECKFQDKGYSQRNGFLDWVCRSGQLGTWGL